VRPCRFELEVEPGEGLALLQSQLLSLLGVPAADQRVFIDALPGAITTDEQLERACSAAAAPPASASGAAAASQPSSAAAPMEIAVMRAEWRYDAAHEQACDLVHEHDAGSGSASAARPPPMLLATAKGEWQGTCTRVFVGAERVRQPVHVWRAAGAAGRAAPVPVCYACATTCMMPGEAAAARMPAGAADAGTFACGCASRGMCLFAERDGAEVALAAASGLGAAIAVSLSDGFYEQQAQAQLQALLPEGARRFPAQAQAMQTMLARMHGNAQHVRLFEDAATQAAALARIPIVALHRDATHSPDRDKSPHFLDQLLIQVRHSCWLREHMRWSGCVNVCMRLGCTPPPPIVGPLASPSAGPAALTTASACAVPTRFPLRRHAAAHALV
jgi:hypothetical protein